MNNENKAENNTAENAKLEGKNPTQVFVTDYQKQLMAQWDQAHPGEPAPMIVQGTTARWVNRKERRMYEATSRRKPKHNERTFKDTMWNMIKAMKESPRVQEKILSGALDQYLPTATDNVDQSAPPFQMSEQEMEALVKSSQPTETTQESVETGQS